MNQEILGIWLVSFLTVCILSFLYRDNPFYKFAEHLYVGISAGYWTVVDYTSTIKPNLIDHLINRDVSYWPVYFIPLALCIMVFTKLNRNWSWMARWPLAFVLGAFSGAAIPAIAETDIVIQVTSTMINLREGTWFNAFSNLVLIVGVICALMYFFFSKPHKVTLGVASRIGIWFLMISFGASFGYTVMARVSLAIGRSQELIDSSGPESFYATPVCALIVIVCLVIFTVINKDKNAPETPGN